MPRLRVRLCPVLLLLAAVFARAAEPAIIPLWPEGVPNRRTDAPPETVVDGRIVHVHEPTLTVYAPTRTPANGTAVIVCPGGGYVRLAIGENGGPQVRWLNDLGVTAFVLKYRLDDYGQPAPLQDVLRAIRLVRRDAAKLGLDPKRIGVWGASAGGHVAACAATMWDDPAGATGAEIDAVSARPDFVALIYPVVTMDPAFAHRGSRRALLGEKPSDETTARWSVERRVRADMPPVFIAATMADRSVPVTNSLRLYDALVTAKVPAEMHVYAQGSHGNSLDPQYGPTAAWPERCADWLRFNGWLPAAPGIDR